MATTRREGAKRRAAALSRLVLNSGEAVVLPDGDYAVASFNGIKNATLKAENQWKAIVRGSSRLKEGNTLRFEDCESAVIDGIEVTGAWRGSWGVTSSITYKNVHFHHNGQEGSITGGCNPAIWQGCLSEFNDNRYGPKPASTDHPENSANHAYYSSYGNQNSLLLNSVGRHCGGCGLHTNWNSEQEILQRNFHGENLEFYYCGDDGTPCIQPDGTLSSSLVNVVVAYSPVGIFTWYHDGEGARVACHDWVIENLTAWNPDGKFNIHVGAGTRNIVYRRGIFVLADAPLIDTADTLKNLPASVRHRHAAWATVRSKRIPPATVVEGSSAHRYLLEAAHSSVSFEDCLFFARSRDQVPAIYRSGNTVKDIGEAEALFPNAKNLDFTPADPGVTQGWRRIGAPAPNPTPERKYKDCPSCVGAGFPAGKVPA
jgi:hypothetical protein